MKFRMYFDPDPGDELDPKPWRDAIERFMTKSGFVLKERLKTYDFYQRPLTRASQSQPPSGLVTNPDSSKKK